MQARNLKYWLQRKLGLSKVAIKDILIIGCFILVNEIVTDPSKLHNSVFYFSFDRRDNILYQANILPLNTVSNKITDLQCVNLDLLSRKIGLEPVFN